MKIIKRSVRLFRINLILMRYNIGEIILGKNTPLHFLVYFNPYYWFRDKSLTRGERIRLALEALGPIFVKAGQIISTRRDFIPDDVAIELAKLQDRVPPFPGKKAKAIIEKTLNAPISQYFSEFDKEALASASIAQVHAARLQTGESVIIKVLRPNIKKIIERDVDILISFAKAAERYSSYAKQLKPTELVKEVAQTLFDELDLLREAANASQLKRNLANTDLAYIPTVYWPFTHHNVLVMERIHGVPIHDIATLKAHQVDLKKLAATGIQLFLTQVFRDSYFHADLHPGNIFVDITDPKNPTYIMVDFGIVGSLNQNDQRYLAENMLAFFKRDYQRVAELHIACGWLPPDTRIDQFEGAVRAVSEPIFEQPSKEISFGKLLLRLFQVAHRFRLNIQPQLVLLQKTLLSIESQSRALDPELDIWQTAMPEIEKWLKRQVGPFALIKRIRKNLPLWSTQLPELPGLVYEVLKETKESQEAKRFHAYQPTPRLGYLKLKYLIVGFTLSTLLFVLYLTIK